MHLFFSEDVAGDVIVLSVEESRHAAQVLRMRLGERVMVTDGCGVMCWGELMEVSSKSVVVRVLERVFGFEKRAYRVHMAVAPTKNIDRYEWFLEKATEIGVDRITPLLCDHSERKVVKLERSEKVVIGAVKQSQKAYVPQVDELTRFSDFLKELSSEASGKQLYIAHCDDAQLKIELKDTLSEGGDYVILIGPEGDFSPEEVASAHQAGFRSVGLGQSRLRTETAALYAVTLAAVKN